MRITLGFAMAAALAAQQGPPEGFGPPRFGPGFGPPPGFGKDRKIVKDYDKNGDKRLDAAERAAAREALAKEPPRGMFPRRGGAQAPPEPGRTVTAKDVMEYAGEPLYDPGILRTLFLKFENADWEKELAAFHGADVDVPAELTVDGKTYPGVGVHFRGMSSYMMVGEGRKRSLNLSLDHVDRDQRLLGYRTLNLLNSHEDPTYLRTALYLQAARDYVPAPKANWVRVVINGESWGIYVSQQQFNSEFAAEWFGDGKGARWKVPGSPMGRGGLAYIGGDVKEYRRIYEIKSKDNKESWAALVSLCRILAETPPDRLEEALKPVLDVEGALRFLALEKALINSDGYWTRASDYSIYRDGKGVFHVIPHDANETLRPAMGPGMGGPGGGRGPGGPGFPPPGFQPPPGFGPPPEGERPGGPRGPRGPMPAPNAELDPFAGADDPNKALLHKLLAVPAFRQRYLKLMGEIAAKWLDWNRLGPLTAKYQSLIAAEVEADARKLDSFENFRKALTEETSHEMFPGSPGRPVMSMKDFVEKRRAYLLSRPEIAKAME